MTAVATTLSSQHSNTTSAQHNYGTRIRQNSVIRPSARLRQSPGPPLAPRKIRPVPSKLKAALPSSSPEPQGTLPPFPPPHVMLHSDDANSKVFLAIGRSFMSVNNRAMTIKDLAEMTMKFGLMCQNVSAAGQAITTYIRNHLQRCETEQDHPLLLRHTLSGTPSDDELAPALHSRVGGAHCTLSSDGRTTNFRRGTMVWYLSKAAGAPCPFSRAGIQLSDYTENGKVGTTLNPAKERKRERDRLRRAQQCGQKRKRLPRACADKGAESESSDEERRPPKVKLTLRLRPSSASCRSSESPVPQSSSPSAVAHSPEIIDLSHDDDSDSDSSEDDSMSLESSESSEDESEDELPSWPQACTSSPHPASHAFDSSALEEEPNEDDPVYSRSSIPLDSDASASPPPDSEDEEDDFHISMTGNYHIASDTYDEDDMDWYSDHMGDIDETDTQWGESPGPRSPSVQFEEEEVTVKQEPRDVRSLLEAWDDFDIDISPTDMKVLDVVARAAQDVQTPSALPLKVEPVDTWDWEGFGNTESSSFPDTLGNDEYLAIKQEEDDPSLPFDSIEPLENICQSPLSSSPSTSAASSPCDYYAENVVESRRPSGCLWHDAEILGPDSVKPKDLEEGAWHSSSAIRKEVPIEPESSSRCTHLISSQGYAPPSIAEQASSGSAATSSLPSHVVIHSPVPKSKPQLPPVQVAARGADYPVESDPEQPVVVHTCQPCVPAICATELEGVSVYQMTLGSFMILRRIDTDFVNISPIYDFLGLPHPPLDIANAVTVCQGSSIICGTWVPAPTARQMIGDQSLVNVFLSDQLNERFPPALQDFYRANTQGRSLEQFGSHFRSTVEAKRESNSSFKLELPSRDVTSPWERGGISPWDVEDHLLSVHPPFALAAAARPPPLPSPEGDMLTETPLSPKEEEMFHSLCSAPEWEPISDSASSAEPGVVDEESESQEPPPRSASKLRTRETVRERPLRRSKRVANAGANPMVVTRSRTRSSKRDSRSSLS